MRILLVGYGKMGKAIEQVLLQRGHTVAGIIDQHNMGDWALYSTQNADAAIEFTEPSSAFNNISNAFHAGIPMVSGTTGWLARKPEADALCQQLGGAFLSASNFSIGVNLFFALNKHLAKLMEGQPQYAVSMEEIHHTEKKDAPSGTAITLAEGVISNNSRTKQWHLAGEGEDKNGSIPITALRQEGVPGTHEISYTSDIDTIEIKHTAHTRFGFALGAVMATEWLSTRKGVFSMQDMLGF